MGLLLGGSCILIGGGLVLLQQFCTEQKRQVKQQQRRRVIAEAEADPELLPEIRQADVETAEHAGSVKVHVELPNSEIISFRVKKRRLGATFDELCTVILKGVPPKTLTAAQLSGMEMQYEDKDGDMVVLTSSSDIADLISDAQAIFVSKRTKKPGTRISSGPRALTAGADVGGPPPGCCCAVSLPASPPELIPLHDIPL